MNRLTKMGVAAVLLALVGCSKDAQIEDFIKEHDALVEEVAKATDADAAQKAFQAKKDELSAKLETFKHARGFQVKKETMSKLTESLIKGGTKVCTLSLKALGDKEKSEKFRSICTDYRKALSL